MDLHHHHPDITVDDPRRYKLTIHNEMCPADWIQAGLTLDEVCQVAGWTWMGIAASPEFIRCTYASTHMDLTIERDLEAEDDLAQWESIEEALG